MDGERQERKMALTAPQMFQEWASESPMPWREHQFRRGLIVDAKGEAVCWIDGSDPNWRNIASMIIVAVNTCGGFKAEIVDSKSYPPPPAQSGESGER